MSDQTFNAEVVDAIFHERDQLEAENAKLREQGARLFDKTLELGTENAKLRRLAQRMFDVISSRNSWWDGTCKDTEHFACLMRELGIEVMK